jgi:hypothetical protein
MFVAWVLLRDVALFLFAVGGLALPWLPLLRRWPATERLTLAVGGALLTGYLAAFAVYSSGVDWRWFWVAPAFGALLGARRAAWDPAWRRPLLAYATIALWCLGWHALVVTYSGAAWQVDWWEHYDRAHFFLARWPVGFRFADVYPLTARPPLVNLWAAAFLSGSGGAYFNYQVFMTLASCLAVLPLVALVQRWRTDHRGVPVLIGALMASPLFMQNATFPWTKLVCAFFVLAAWLQLADDDGLRGRYLAAALALAGGMLAHYSAGPWIVALAVAWLVTRRREWSEVDRRREIVLASAVAGALLLTWIGWAAAHYGWRSTFTDNTTVAIAPGGDFAARVARAAGNLFHTVWPVSTVGLDHPLLAQSSALGRLRDGWFILYQLKLWWALGAAGGAVLLATLWRERPGRTARFALVASVVVIVLGTVVHSQPDALGLTHIALQPLVLFALAWLAARAREFPCWLRRLWLAGLALDFVCGIALHFGVQSGLLDRWLRDVPPARIWESYTQAAAVGFENKVNLHLTFLADLSTPLGAIVLLSAAALLGIVVGRREMTFPARPPSP